MKKNYRRGPYDLDVTIHMAWQPGSTPIIQSVHFQHANQTVERYADNKLTPAIKRRLGVDQIGDHEFRREILRKLQLWSSNELYYLAKYGCDYCFEKCLYGDKKRGNCFTCPTSQLWFQLTSH